MGRSIQSGAGMRFALSTGVVVVGMILAASGIPGCAPSWWTPPQVTSSTGMAGLVLAASDGAPLAGVEVVNLESSTLTDENGHFGLYYKRPDQHISLQVDGVWFRRTYRPEDDGKRLKIQLPEVAASTLDCGGFTCSAELKWDFGDNLSARVRKKCTGDARPTVHIPSGPVEVTCRQGAETVDLVARASMGTVQLLPPSRPVQVTLDADEVDEPCTAFGGAAEVLIEDAAMVDVHGQAWIHAVCAGVPTIPKRATTDTVALAWSSGPVLQPPAGVEMPWLVLSSPEGWVVRIQAGPEGGFPLPPLRAGTYRIQITDGAAETLPLDLELSEPDALVGRMLSGGSYALGLKLSQERLDGVLEARMKEEP